MLWCNVDVSSFSFRSLGRGGFALCWCFYLILHCTWFLLAERYEEERRQRITSHCERRCTWLQIWSWKKQPAMRKERKGKEWTTAAKEYSRLYIHLTLAAEDSTSPHFLIFKMAQKWGAYRPRRLITAKENRRIHIISSHITFPNVQKSTNHPPSHHEPNPPFFLSRPSLQSRLVILRMPYSDSLLFFYGFCRQPNFLTFA